MGLRVRADQSWASSSWLTLLLSLFDGDEAEASAMANADRRRGVRDQVIVVEETRGGQESR